MDARFYGCVPIAPLDSLHKSLGHTKEPAFIGLKQSDVTAGLTVVNLSWTMRVGDLLVKPVPLWLIFEYEIIKPLTVATLVRQRRIDNVVFYVFSIELLIDAHIKLGEGAG